jgi:hypothetical protein
MRFYVSVLHFRTCDKVFEIHILQPGVRRSRHEKVNRVYGASEVIV